MKRLKRYLEERKIAQTEFARDMDVSQPTVSDWINGNVLPSAETLKRMSNKTGLSIDALLDHVPPRHSSRSSPVRKAV